MDSIKIVPYTSPSAGSLEVPGSKSISNRALILSVMCDAEIELIGLLESEDVDLMQEALRKLEIKIEKSNGKTKIKGTGGKIPNKKCNINVGNAGTIARFLTCLLAAQDDGEYFMDGTEAMRERPMMELLKSLIGNGCRITFKEKYGYFPFTLLAQGIKESNIEIDARKSGQIISGLLMQCPKVSNKCTISFSKGTVSFPFIEMTLKMMRSFSDNKDFSYTIENKSVRIENCNYKKSQFTYLIEPDATAASYFLSLPLVTGGECHILGLSREMLQGDIAYCDIIERIGAEIHYDRSGVTCRATSTLMGGSFNFNDISDTFLTLAAISPLMNDKLEIYGIEHTRNQETDRVAGMARELRKLGQDVDELPDRLIVYPDLNKLKRAARSGISISTYNDHRFAMSFAILGCFDLLENGQPWLSITDPNCCAKTFPDFFTRLNTHRKHTCGS